MITAPGAITSLIKCLGNKSFWCWILGFLETGCNIHFFPGLMQDSRQLVDPRELTCSDLVWERSETREEGKYLK